MHFYLWKMKKFFSPVQPFVSSENRSKFLWLFKNSHVVLKKRKCQGCHGIQRYLHMLKVRRRLILSKGSWVIPQSWHTISVGAHHADGTCIFWRYVDAWYSRMRAGLYRNHGKQSALVHTMLTVLEYIKSTSSFEHPSGSSLLPQACAIKCSTSLVMRRSA